MNRAALSFLGTPHISRRRLWWGVQLYKKRVIRTCVRMNSLERSIRARRSPGRRCTSRYTRWDRLRIPCRTRARKNRCRVAGLAWSSILVQRICERIFRHGMRQPWIVRVHRRDSLDALGKSGAFFRLDQIPFAGCAGQAQGTPRFSSYTRPNVHAQTRSGPQRWSRVTSVSTMKWLLNLFALFALFSLVLASDPHGMIRRRDHVKRDDDICYKCVKSYFDCFRLFGFQGCTEKDAEHYTWCRQCTGEDPPW